MSLSALRRPIAAALLWALWPPAGGCALTILSATAWAIEPGFEDAPIAKGRVGGAGGSGGETAQTEGEITDETITIVVVGDTGLNAHMQPVRAQGALRHGDLLPFDLTTQAIKGRIDGDLNFMNLETIVTANNNLRRENKSYNFRMHPRGARHLVDIGFNLFSTANNHSMDFAAAGARDTLRHLEELEAKGLLAYPGLGLNRDEAARPWPIDVKGSRVMISALGITTRGFPAHRAGTSRVGQMSYRSRQDFAAVTGRLGNALSAYRILSVHYGAERSVTLGRDEIANLRGIALQESDVDLVLGHHAHVARAVEITNGKVIFYGLGNFLHHGTADMRKYGICRDYGLLAKLHLRKMAGGRLAVRAIEAMPLTQMHRQTRVMNPKESRQRVHVLNYLARGVDNADAGAKGVRFTPRADGSGLYCVAGAGADPGSIGALCRDWLPASPPPAALARRIRNSCGASARAQASRGSRNRRRSSGKRKAKKSFFSKVFGF